MKKEIREVAGNLMRVTTSDERWYAKPLIDPVTAVPTGWRWVPSVTWICDHYPKGVGFYKWLAATGWDEAQALKEAAGDKGSKVHTAVSALIEGATVRLDDAVLNPSTEQPEPLSLAEYDCLMSFVAWVQERRPQFVAHDLTVWSEAHDYAGTLDFAFVEDVAGVRTLVLPDAKTSKEIWPSHELQVSAYRHTPEVEALVQHHGCTAVTLAILQLGYARNKKRFKFTEVPDQFPLFLAARQIWAKETAGQHPLQRDYPMSLSLNGTAMAPAATSALGRSSTPPEATARTGGM